MAIYSVEFKPLSVLTKIPDAQTIFGAFCYKYKELYGNDKLDKFLDIEKNTPIFLLSSMFYKNVLPFPLDFRPKFNPNITLEETLNNKKLKKIKYISKDLYIKYVSEKEKFCDNYFEDVKNNYQIINKEILSLNDDNILKEKYVENDTRIRNSNPNREDKGLFRDEVIYCNPKLSFQIYLNIIDETYKDEILNVFENMNYVFFGGNKSIGYNLYEFVNIERENKLENLNHKMLLSKSLANSDVDYDNSNYGIELLVNKFNVQGNKLNRKQVMVLREGSVLNTSNDYSGGLVEEEQNGMKTYQYYYGMMI